MSDTIDRFKAKKRERDRLACRHFVPLALRGPQPTHCEAGVLLAPLGPPLGRPCLRGGVGCGRFSPRSEEELDAHEKEIQESFARITKARALIVEVTGGARGVGGSVACPVCQKANLCYTVARNGHIHAVCPTPGCVRWME